MWKECVEEGWSRLSKKTTHLCLKCHSKEKETVFTRVNGRWQVFVTKGLASVCEGQRQKRHLSVRTETGQTSECGTVAVVRVTYGRTD